MNCDQTKIISIREFLLNNGCAIFRENEREVWFYSPFRDEKTASFKVDLRYNVWRDFGEGSGGDLITLVKHLFKMNTQEALKVIAAKNYSSFSFPKQDDFTSTPLEITKVGKLKNRSLIEYCISRGITHEIADAYLKEVYYKIKEKRYFSLGFQNDENGYELRNKYFKNSTTPKTITSIEKPSRIVDIFEGFFDFLSSLIFYKKSVPLNNTIILNSTSLIFTALPKLRQFEQVNLFVDNDEAGTRVKELLQSFRVEFKDNSHIYKGYKDFNEYLKNNC